MKKVLIPYSSGHFIKHLDSACIGRSHAVLIPYSSGHFIKHCCERKHKTVRTGLNPLFIRSFYQTKNRQKKRHIRNRVLIPYSSGHFIKHLDSACIGRSHAVLIPYSSGHFIKQRKYEEGLELTEVLIPYSSGHFIKRTPQAKLC